MKRASRVVWGIVIIAVGVLYVLSALEIAEFNLFFDGWWTMFIIIPSAIGLFTDRDKGGQLIGLAIGVLLLLCCQDILEFRMFWKLLVPIVIIIVGVKMVFGGIFGGKASKIMKEMKANGADMKSCCATFSKCNVNFDDQMFDGAELTATFGGVECDLRKAIIEKDCVIQVSAIFGGIDIQVPKGVNVKVSSTGIFGGISNKAEYDKQNEVTIYVNGTCMFGGVDIK